MKAYNDKIIPGIGVCRVKGRYKNRPIQTTMEVVPDQGPSLLGSTDCERLGLVERVDTVGHTTRTLQDEIQLNKAVNSHEFPVSLTDFGNFSRLTAGRHKAHGYL